MVATTDVALVGASSQVGPALIAGLTEAGHAVVEIARQHVAAPPGAIPRHVFDASRSTFTPALERARVVISLAPLPHVSTVVQMARQLGAERVIAFGSSSVFTKADSTAEIERNFVRDQRAAEGQLAEGCGQAGIHWTLFRPTMIYGAGVDLNVEFIRAVSRRLRCFPLPYGADGRRQPVHVEDLATACVASVASPASADRAYNLGGGEILTYSDMVCRIVAAEGRRCVLLRVPPAFYRAAVKLTARRPRFAHLRPEMVDRMFDDLIVDNAPAQMDFGYAPRAFCPAAVSAP